MTPQKYDQPEEDLDLPEAEEMDGHDMDEALYDAESEAQMWDEAPEGEPSAAPAPARKKKKGGLFNWLLIVGGGLVFLGLVYTQLGAPKPPAATAPQPPMQEAPPTPSAEGPLTPMPEEVMASETGTPAQQAQAPGELAVLQKAPETEPAPAPSAAPGFEAVDPPATEPAVPATGESMPPAEMQPQPLAVAPMAPAVEPPAIVPVAPEGQPTAQPVPLPPVTETMPQTPASSAPADAQRLQELENRVLELASQVKAAETPQPAVDLSGVMDQIDRLAARLDSLESKLKSRAEKAPSKETEEPKVQETPVAAKPKVSKPAIRPVYKLKAVSGEVAYVAQPPARTLTPIRVGETLPGMGKVTAITQQGSSWQVETEKGKISQ